MPRLFQQDRPASSHYLTVCLVLMPLSTLTLMERSSLEPAGLDGETINAEPAGFDEDRIRQVWEEVSEDMRPFKINVTTDRAVFDAAAQNKKMMCIVTPTTDAFPGSGGVAYFNSFYDGSVDPCWCFNRSVGSCAQTVSHEIGHTFGLSHDGLTSQNDPDVSQRQRHLGAHHGGAFWSQCGDLGAMETMRATPIPKTTLLSSTRGLLPFRDDQYGDSAADGFDLAGEAGEEAVGIVGVIETPDDVDVFSFTTRGGSVTLGVEPEGVAIGGSKFVTNMNVRVQLYNEAGDLLAEDDPENSYAASITTELEAGNYTFHVEGANSGSPDVSGFSDYGSIGQYGLTGDVEGLGGLIVEINQPQLEEVSIAAGNGLVVAASVIGGSRFCDVAGRRVRHLVEWLPLMMLALNLPEQASRLQVSIHSGSEPHWILSLQTRSSKCPSRQLVRPGFMRTAALS